MFAVTQVFRPPGSKRSKEDTEPHPVHLSSGIIASAFCNILIFSGVKKERQIYRVAVQGIEGKRLPDGSARLPVLDRDAGFT